MAHYIVRCPCGTVVSQCRCIGKKEERVALCPSCKRKAEIEYLNKLTRSAND